MTIHQAAAALGMQVSSLQKRVGEHRILPEQPLGSVRQLEWTFSEAEVERFRRERAAGIERKRQWNSRGGLLWQSRLPRVVA